MAVFDDKMEAPAVVKMPMTVWGSESIERVCVRWNEEEEEAGLCVNELLSVGDGYSVDKMTIEQFVLLIKRCRQKFYQ